MLAVVDAALMAVPDKVNVSEIVCVVDVPFVVVPERPTVSEIV